MVAVRRERVLFRIEYFESPDDIPSGEEAIYVRFGPGDSTVEDGNSVVMTVNGGPLSDHLAGWRIKIAIESAKDIGRRKGLAVIYVCRRRPAP